MSCVLSGILACAVYNSVTIITSWVHEPVLSNKYIMWSTITSTV